MMLSSAAFPCNDWYWGNFQHLTRTEAEYIQPHAAGLLKMVRLQTKNACAERN